MVVFNKSPSDRAIPRECVESGQRMASPTKGAFPESCQIGVIVVML